MRRLEIPGFPSGKLQAARWALVQSMRRYLTHRVHTDMNLPGLPDDQVAALLALDPKLITMGWPQVDRQ